MFENACKMFFRAFETSTETLSSHLVFTLQLKVDLEVLS